MLARLISLHSVARVYLIFRQRQACGKLSLIFFCIAFVHLMYTANNRSITYFNCFGIVVVVDRANYRTNIPSASVICTYDIHTMT